MTYESNQRKGTEHDWALVLAGGEGTRLQTLTTTSGGVCIPKQFCSFGAGPSLLHAALQRARRVVPTERTCTIVAEHHRRWWQSLPLGLPAENVVAQPLSRGTAHGILLPLLQILHRDPDASLLVLPADHYVRDESTLAASLRQAIVHAGKHDLIVLLGLRPEDADPELGYIVSEGEVIRGVHQVSRFIEKPSTASARALISRGGLWNSFIFAASGRTLLRAFEACCPDTVAELRCVIERSKNPAQRQRRLTGIYEAMPELDFSRDILQRQTAQLGVLMVPYCGWSDLGTPRRVAEALQRHESTGRELSSWATHARGFLDLAARHSQLQAVR